MFALQVAAYAAGIGAVFIPAIGRNRLANAVSSLLVLNTAALLSWFVYFSGQAGRSWKKVVYTAPSGTMPASS
jgi:hypothetical protein